MVWASVIYCPIVSFILFQEDDNKVNACSGSSCTNLSQASLPLIPACCNREVTLLSSKSQLLIPPSCIRLNAWSELFESFIQSVQLSAFTFNSDNLFCNSFGKSFQAEFCKISPTTESESVLLSALSSDCDVILTIVFDKSLYIFLSVKLFLNAVCTALNFILPFKALNSLLISAIVSSTIACTLTSEYNAWVDNVLYGIGENETFVLPCANLSTVADWRFSIGW